MYELVRANKIRSAALTLFMALILFLVSYAIAEYAVPGSGYIGVLIGFVLWIILTLISFYAGPSIYLALGHARKIKKEDNPRLFNIVEEMTIASGLPKMPDVYIIEDPMPNAFATGRNPKVSAIAVTTGLLQIMNRDELQGVIAHEMAHVKNRDVLYMLVVGIMVGVITILADLFVRGFLYGRRSRSASKAPAQAQAIILIVGIVVIVLSPIIARIVYLAISRKREYLADASAALFTRYPEGLASALEKIEAFVQNAPPRLLKANATLAPMYIVNPLTAKKKRDSLFSTHPSTENRIRILRGMGGASFVDYNAAYKKIIGKAEDLIKVDKEGGEGTVSVRSPSGEEVDKKVLSREAMDTLWKSMDYQFITCSCGLKFKIPPTFKGDRIVCPRCGTVHDV